MERLAAPGLPARRMYRVLGVEHVRHRRPAAPEVVLRRLLSLDYLLERPHTSWLPTEAEQVNALTAAGIARDVLPRRLYQGAVGVQYRYFPHKLPVALDTWRATFVFVQDEDETDSVVRTWARSMPRCGRGSSRPAAPSRWSSWAGTRNVWPPRSPEGVD